MTHDLIPAAQIPAASPHTFLAAAIRPGERRVESGAFEREWRLPIIVAIEANEAPPMSESSPWLLVVNPSAGRGRGARMIPHLTRSLARCGVDARIVVSERPGHVARLAREGADAGIRHFAAVGGDGTAHELANGLAEHAGSHGVPAGAGALSSLTLAIVPIGTGNDWARSLGAPRSFDASIDRIARGRTRCCDLGRIDYRGAQGAASRVFVNVAGAGFDGFVLERLGRRKPGPWAYLVELLRSHRRYEPPVLSLEASGIEAHDARGPGDHPTTGSGQERYEAASSRTSLAVFASLGSHCGGGMRIAPGARLDDGLIDVTQIGAMSGRQLLWELRRLFDGTLHSSRHVRAFTTRSLEIGSAPASRVQADGELLGLTPARIQVLPAAIRVVCG